jgi:hypothetical protein
MRRELPDVPIDAITAAFRIPGAAWTIDELAGRFGRSIAQAIHVMADLEVIDVVRRLDDEFVPGPRARTPA